MDRVEQFIAQGGRLLIVPGWRDSGYTHWQSRWHRRYPGSERLVQADWEHPHAADWVAALRRKIAESDAPTLLVAHSLGCITVAHWAALAGSNHPVVAALLVAPADVARPHAPVEFRGFLPLPHRRLPFPSVLVASDSDDACSAERASHLASTWGSRLAMLRGVGHINVESRHGPWPVGRQWLRRIAAEHVTQHTEPALAI
ncbi:RBBP9/YdeN family alpha/beta hydrolase [Chitinolyticbacter albus]|uniref:RBBP9/YdeN family alpha/beta hydrolase n=1 Tax=Chitinolyticbacter albus TaxID=2961951 RepID=UPI0021096774|nr:alpha/beta hydrolase [Chitinolyticbacter albus]